MSDLIDRQAAIDHIDAVFPVDPMRSKFAQGIACGAALAKTYIKQLPSAQPDKDINVPNTDCISRQDAFDAVNRAVTKEAARLSIIEMPSAQKTGRWEKVRSANYGTDFRCSACHRYRFHNGEMRNKYIYCPNCGAKMEEKTE